DTAGLENVERLVQLDGDVVVARDVHGRAMTGRLVLEGIECQEVDGQRPRGDGELRDVDVLRDGFQAEHGVEAEGDAELHAVLDRQRLLHEAAPPWRRRASRCRRTAGWLSG